MKSMIVVVFLSLVAIVLLNVEPGEGASNFDCEKAKTSLVPCLNYLVGADDDPSIACCNAVKDLKDSMHGTDDRRTACKCLVAAAKLIPNISDDKLATLPDKCGVQLGFPIKKDMDCSK